MKKSATVLLSALLGTILACTPCREYKKPTGLIDQKTALSYEKNYTENQYRFINKHLSDSLHIHFQDHREVFFNLENLENYLDYVKKESKKKGYKNVGIRVYLGAKKQGDAPYKTTVFLAPTHQTEAKGTAFTNTNSTGINALNFGSSGEPADIYGEN